MNRRSALGLLVTTGIGALAACKTGGERRDSTMSSSSSSGSSTSSSRAGAMPAIFLAHGSPFLLDDNAWMNELHDWARAMPRPSSVLMISAHWERAPMTVGATRTIPLVYDFYGFPQKYYDLKYAAPGAPDLAKRVRELASSVGPVASDESRGLDHGAYVPMVAMYPEADVPTLQISIPTMDAGELVALGRALAPLRSEGVLIVGSGFLTHNMRTVDFDGASGPPAWASDFDGWSAVVLARRDVDSLAHYKDRAPGVRMALPTHEHFVPVAVAMGASIDRSESVTFPITGFAYGSFTKRSIQFG
jgi:4,5-DOPA dioxygenase extradiol